ncbi:hypothetical protein, partial [Zoogloea oryzae]|uniref:hypothetical protein n=1 Tax=Zoogloea oryzae TaxID=310767 RepID=UPI0024E0E42B
MADELHLATRGPATTPATRSRAGRRGRQRARLVLLALVVAALAAFAWALSAGALAVSHVDLLAA